MRLGIGWLKLAVVLCVLSGCSLRGGDQQVKLFSYASECAACHANLKDSAGVDYSYNGLWQASMHASASVDPYYIATVRNETNQYPEIKAAVEEKCSVCHMPLANWTSRAAGKEPIIFDKGYIHPDNALHKLYQDGISCTACHQIQPENLGSESANSGGYQIDTKTPSGKRDLYGPFQIAPDMASMMQPVGYLVKQSDHLGKVEFCAVCHTLFTSPVGKDGKASEVKFPEQTPYLEWEHGSVSGESTCQTCHMPAVTGEAKISIMNGPARSPLNQHSFSGANVQMISLLKKNAQDFGITATDAQFEAALERTQTRLQQSTAALQVNPRLEGDQLLVDVVVSNQSGHKLPTGFPSRRVWLHVTVKDAMGGKDAQGAVVFESGGWKADGSISGNDNDGDPAVYEPHYSRIDSPEQVQIYEPVFANLEGNVTTGVIEAAEYLKDNRLLPAGFDKTTAAPEIAVKGEALTDPNFGAGQDAITYQIGLNGAKGPLTVRVELAYQSISYRWMKNLQSEPSAESERVQKLNTDTAPVILAEEEVEVK